MPQRVDRPLITGALGLGALALALTWQPVAQSAGAAANTNAAAEHTQPAAERDKAETTAPSADAPSFDRYRRLLELNPFSPRLPKKTPPAVAPSSAPPVIPPVTPVPPADVKKPEAPPAGAPPVVPAPPDPLSGWVYSGTVAIGSDVYAVVENKTSKQGRYMKVGDNLEGFTIDQVAQGELVLTLNGQPRNLAKSTAFNVTPLSGGGGGAPAGGPGGPGAPGVPGAPGGPAGMPGGRPGPVPAGVRTSLPGGRVIAPPVMDAPVFATPVILK